MPEFIATFSQPRIDASTEIYGAMHIVQVVLKHDMLSEYLLSAPTFRRASLVTGCPCPSPFPARSPCLDLFHHCCDPAPRPLSPPLDGCTVTALPLASTGSCTRCAMPACCGECERWMSQHRLLKWTSMIHVWNHTAFSEFSEKA